MRPDLKIAITRAAAPWIALAVLAGIATFAVGSGNILADGASELHLDPEHFLRQILYAWTPTLFLGSHTGAMHVYLSAATLVYALLFAIHVPLSLTQRLVDFSYFLSICSAMYWMLGELAPSMGKTSRLCGAAACLLNPYVAFNSNGSTPFLLLYSEIPWLTGITAAVARGHLKPRSAGLLVAIVTLIGSGNNMPLTFLAVLVASLYALVALIATAYPVALFRKLVPFALYAFALTLILNLYWLVPVIDWYRTAWLGGVLDETPAMHNGDSSFANVLRGFGQWAIFKGDEAGPWYRWASSYVTGIYSSFLWAVTTMAMWAPTFRRSRNVATAFFLAVVVISVPLAVGYYHGSLGDAITMHIYDFVYWQLPGFQIFRSSYKLVSPVSFAIAGLFAISLDGFTAWILQFSKLPVTRRQGAVICVQLVAMFVVIASYLPVMIDKANDPLPLVPQWINDEKTFAGTGADFRLGVFPTQYLERFAWGSPMYFVENGLIDRGLIQGYLGSAPTKGSNQWIKRAFHAAREDEPIAANIFSLLSVSDVLQRDDFDNRLTPDFAFSSELPSNTTSTAHDLISRVLHGLPVAQDGANLRYRLSNALPSIYAVEHPTLAAFPEISNSEDVANMSRGEAQISADSIGIAGLTDALAGGAVISKDPYDLDALTTTIANSSSITLDVQIQTLKFSVPASGYYMPFATDTAFIRHPGRSLEDISIGGAPLTARSISTSGWQHFAPVYLRAGSHYLEVPSATWADSVRFKLVERESFKRLRVAVGLLAARVQFSRIARDVVSDSTLVTVPRDGNYSIAANRFSNEDSYDNDEPVQMREVGMDALLRKNETSAPFFPLLGIGVSVPTMMPQLWYTNPSLYSWDRANPEKWFLLTRNVVMLVFNPYQKTHALFTARLASMANGAPVINRAFRILVNGRHRADFMLAGGNTFSVTRNADLFEHAGKLQLVSARVTLDPGVNEVRIENDGVSAVAAKGVSDAIDQPYHGYNAQFVAVMAPDVAFTLHTSGSRKSSNSKKKPGVHIYELLMPANRLNGDPHLAGTFVSQPTSRPIQANLIVHFGIRGRADSGMFRTSALSTAEGSFDVELASLLPNSPSDEDIAVDHAWIVTTSIASSRGARDRRGAHTPQVTDVTYRRAILSPQTHVATKLEHAKVFTEGFATHISRERSFIRVSFAPRAPARATTIAFSLLAPRPERNARLVIPFSTDWMESNARMDIYYHGAWHLVGNTMDLLRSREGRNDGATISTFRAPPGLNVSEEDYRSGRVSIEIDGTPRQPNALFDDSLPNVLPDFANGELSSITVTSRALPRTVRVTSMPPSWLNSSYGRYFLSVPAESLQPRSGKSVLVRLYVDVAPDFALDRRRSIDVFVPRWSSTTETQRNSLCEVLVDGHALHSGHRWLRAGKHSIEPIDPSDLLGHVTIALTDEKTSIRVDVGNRRRSPVALDALINPHTSPLLLVFGDSYHPEWRATVNGRSLTHFVVNGFENGWLVPAATLPQHVDISFTAQALFDLSLGASLMAMTCILVTICVAWRRSQLSRLSNARSPDTQIHGL